MFYVIAMVTTRKISIEYTHEEMRKGLKHITTKNKINKTGGKAIREERRDKKSYKTYGKQLTKWE